MDFIQIKALDIVDILLVALLMYQLYRLIRKTNALSIFTGILIVYLLWLVVRVLNMELLSLLLGQVIGVGAIALIIVFQPEIRKFLFLLGERYSKRRSSFLGRFFFGKAYEDRTEWLNQLVLACEEMAETYTGALIVIRRSSDMAEFMAQGEVIDALVKKDLIENIFFKNSPLHDGAMLIEGDRIKAVRCILPVSERTDIPGYFGTRHRAALGASEISDALVVVVSEERGQISFVQGGEITAHISGAKLKELISQAMGLSVESSGSRPIRRRVQEVAPDDRPQDL